MDIDYIIINAGLRGLLFKILKIFKILLSI